MQDRRPRPALVFALLGLLTVSSGRRSEASGPTSGRAVFSGTWAVKDETSDDVFHDAEKAGGTAAPAPSGGRRGRGGSSGAGAGAGNALGDLPLDALTDSHMLVIVDEGSALRVSYSSGRKRVLYADGDERELDDGDGPAKVTTKRKGQAGEKIVISSKWSSGRSLTETWELLANPPRLTVTGKASGRQTYHFQRVYVPATVEQVDAAARRPTATPTALPMDAGADVVPAPAEPPAGMENCSIRPPKGTSAADLAGMAKVTKESAEKRAVASVTPLRVTSVISSDVEVDEGCLVWPFDLRLQDKKGVQEVLVDAGDGKVLSSHFEAQNKP